MSLIITRGLPGSGKTTKARSLMATPLFAQRPAVRVNRDDLRAMLHVGPWTAEAEVITRAVRDAAIRVGLAAGCTVICDDTHMQDDEVDWMRTIAGFAGVDLEIIDLRDVPVEECIRRDAARITPVGRAVIERMAAHLP